MIASLYIFCNSSYKKNAKFQACKFAIL